MRKIGEIGAPIPQPQPQNPAMYCVMVVLPRKCVCRRGITTCIPRLYTGLRAREKFGQVYVNTLTTSSTRTTCWARTSPSTILRHRPPVTRF